MGNRRSSWTLEELYEELRNFEHDLNQAGLRATSIRTYVDRSEIFLRWLTGDYKPRGPVKS